MMQIYYVEVILMESFFSLLQGDQAHFEFLSQAFHYGQITGLAVCARKPLIGSCSLDRSVRIWNFENWYVYFLSFTATKVMQNVSYVACSTVDASLDIQFNYWRLVLFY